MTEIIRGEFITNELSKNSNGGTEQMARRMVRDIDQDLLKDFQIIHSRVRDLDPDLKKILVCHDLANDPEVAKLADPEFRNQFEKIVFVSNWQLQMYNLVLGVPYSQSIVIPNGIESIPIEKSVEGPIRLIYHTTPHRGLHILYPVFDHLSKNYDVHLDVFSSFGVYGWSERDEPYKELFKRLEEHPNITYHGAQPNKTVREYLSKSDIFAYPSIWPETSCIAAIEALCSGNLIVHPNFAALPETCEHFSHMYQYDENQQRHANIFAGYLQDAINQIVAIREGRRSKDVAPDVFLKNIARSRASHFNQIYNWNNCILPQWNNLLTSLRD